MMDPNHFLMIMLSRFELYQIFSTPDYGKRFSSEVTHKVRAWVPSPRGLKKPLLLGCGHHQETACHVLTSELPFLQDVVQQNNTLIEEMLYLIIMLVGEFGRLTCL